jgi:hypothetical protein
LLGFGFHTPSKINEEQLSADLDKFARSLRIKEYFLAKESDFPVDGSSDAEDEKEIPLLSALSFPQK